MGSTVLGSGIDLRAVDPRIRAQDDFYRHVNGHWLQREEIPADKSEVSSFSMLDDVEQLQLRTLVEEAARAVAAGTADDNRRKIGDLFGGFMDEGKREEQRLRPLEAEFARIDALRDKVEIPALVAHCQEIGVPTLYDVGVGQDARDSTRYVVGIGQGGLGLPDRDYYLQSDAKLADPRPVSRPHAEDADAGRRCDRRRADADAILALETRIAQAQWTKVENRDPVRTYNKVEPAGLDLLMPGYTHGDATLRLRSSTRGSTT